MRLPVKARHLPPRMATGAFMLNAGLGKWNADEERAARLRKPCSEGQQDPSE